MVPAAAQPGLVAAGRNGQQQQGSLGVACANDAGSAPLNAISPTRKPQSALVDRDELYGEVARLARQIGDDADTVAVAHPAKGDDIGIAGTEHNGLAAGCASTQAIV